ncbi:MAG: hypothetical protein CVU00_01250 [Bacteroidetes bacterium HGW-Bacteroidetes-17]|jgi:ferredoxin|nr:MAG: hypothetical protein CVU00_01250 [Bacteroidetes bacterium HGW-Bacteroidetes-17]
MKKVIIFCLSLFFISSSIIAQNFDYSFKEVFKVNGETQLKLVTSDGFIHLTPYDGNTVEVYFIVRKNNHFIRIDRNELERELDLIVDQSGNRIEVRVRHRDQNWRDWRNRLDVSFEVFAPKNTLGDLQTSDGSIDIGGFTGDQICKTSDGNIEVYNIDGAVYAHTSDGNIKARKIIGETDLSTSDGDITAVSITGNTFCRTSDGDIYIENVEGRTQVGTSDGSIEFHELSGSLKGSTSDGSIKGELINLKGELKLSTSDGNIDVVIPDNLGMDIYLRGENIYTEFSDFSGSRGKHKIEGRVKGGGIPVSLTTSDGRVSLKSR